MSEQNHPNPSLWWKHRRRMAYLSLIFIVVQTIVWTTLALFKSESLEALVVVIGWSYGAPVTVLLAYFGNTLAEELVKRKNGY